MIKHVGTKIMYLNHYIPLKGSKIRSVMNQERLAEPYPHLTQHPSQPQTQVVRLASSYLLRMSFP
jgi:hypothetical protein